MSIFNFLKKKKKADTSSLELPPPPAPEAPLPSAEVRIISELPEVDDFKAEALRPLPPLDEEPPAENLPVPTGIAVEEATLFEEPQTEEQPTHRKKREPAFVSVQDFQDVLSNISYVRTRLGEADELVKKLNTLKDTEEKEFERWRNQLEDLQRKLAYVEDVVFTSS